MKLVSTLLLNILLSFSICNAYKVLVVFPLAGKSHSILGEGYVRRLLDAGHEVTYIAGILSKISSPKLRQIGVPTNAAYNLKVDIPARIYFIQEGIDIQNSKEFAQISLKLANNTIMDVNVQKLINDPKEQFDVVIIEWMFTELYAGFASVFNCPFIWSSTMEPHGKVLSLIDEDPNPAYIPDILTSTIPPLSFTQKIRGLWNLIRNKYIEWQMSYEEEQTHKLAFGSAVAKRGRKLPPLMEVKYNASLILGNSHVSAGQATRLPQNYIPIAGYHIQDTVVALPKDIQKIMDDAKKGVIYFSMGCTMRGQAIPEEIKTGLLYMFRSLEHTVLWSIDEVPNRLPRNVYLLQFGRQQSILAHPNCILFITHGGLLSISETLHYGVPIIGIPVFGDQFLNVKQAAHKGFAKVLNLSYDIPFTLKAAIHDILANPRYRERAKELSLVFHDRPVSPGKELVHWVEHVVKTGGAPHLRSPALMLPWYQKMYLDLTGMIIVVLHLLIICVKKVISSRKIVFKKTQEKKKLLVNWWDKNKPYVKPCER